MNLLDNLFNWLAAGPPSSGDIPSVQAILTSTSLKPAPAASLSYRSDSADGYSPSKVVKEGVITERTPAAISFGLSIGTNENYPGSGQQSVSVVLTKIENPIQIPAGGSPYSMTVTFPIQWGTVTSTANVDSASGVVYGSNASLFVTLVVFNFQWVAPPPK
jgi:hypothetical protein